MPITAANSNKAQSEKELAALKQTIKSVQQQLKANQDAQSLAERQLQKADLELAAIVKQLMTTDSNIKQQRQRLTELEAEKLVKLALAKKQRSLLAAQLKSAYVSGNQEYLKLLLNQQNPASMSRILKYYDYLNQARIDDIEKLQQTLDRLKVIESDTEQSLSQLQQLQQQQTQQQASRLSKKKQQQQALSKLQAEYQQNSTRLQQLKSNEKQLQQLISQLEQKLKDFSPPQSLQGLSKFKRRLQWPVKGKVIHRFGSGKFEDKLKWSGIVIASAEGTRVHSIQQGQVVFSDWLRGFGLLTIIDHGKGYLSLYGQNQSLLKSVGDFVEAGEPISTVGQSGGSSQSGLYFEIRYREKPQNPLLWIKR